MKKLLIGFLSAIALIGCSDNDNEKYPISLVYDKIEPTSEMRVFTDGGKLLASGRLFTIFWQKNMSP